MGETARTGMPFALVVDPDAQFRHLLTSMLGGVARTVGVPDAEAAALLVGRARPDVAIVDPGHVRRGLADLLDHLAAGPRHPRVPVLACTASPLRDRELERMRVDAVLPYRLLSRARLARLLLRLCPTPWAVEPGPSAVVATSTATAVPYPATG